MLADTQYFFTEISSVLSKILWSNDCDNSENTGVTSEVLRLIHTATHLCSKEGEKWGLKQL